MKKTIKFLTTTAFVCFISIMAIANERSTFSVNVAEKNMIHLQLSNTQESQIEVSLIDAFGVLLLDEVLTENKVNHRKYDLHNLPIGCYTLVVAYDNVIKIQTIKKDLETIEIESDKIQTISQPTYRQHAKYVDLNMPCLAKQRFYLKIKDNDGNVIYNNMNERNETLEKRFNLEQLDAGNYTFAVGMIGTGINKVFTQTINWSPIIVK